MKIIVVTGTGTGIGKTVTTAAIASCAAQAGQRVAVVKPFQTGVLPGEPGDLAEVQRLTGITDLHEYVRYSEPLAPATAARRLGVTGPDNAELADRIAALDDRDLILVEGAGGVLVRFNDEGDGLIELIAEVDELLRPSTREHESSVEWVLVTSAGLGALHDTAAAADAIGAWSMRLSSLVIGDWRATPDLAARCNLTDLSSYGRTPVRGVIPHGAGGLMPDAFGEVAMRSLTPSLGGRFDAADFIRRQAAPLPKIESLR